MGGTFAIWLICVGVAVGLIAMVVAVGFAWRYRASLGWMAATLAVWVVITGIFVIVYLRQLQSVAPEAGSPPASDEQAAATAASSPAAVEPDASSLRIFSSSDGHYRVEGLVNGATVQFLVDTGASVVLLTPEDARHAGIDPDTLQYRQQISTPNGMAQGADIVIYQLAIGPIRLVNVVGAVVRSNASGSLLGVSFLSRLSGYEVSDGAMTLHQ
jgi:aspartyl protease family protein